MPGITISAAYGAGGSLIAPRVAQRLGFTLLDRAISAQVAHDLQISQQEAEQAERKRGFADWFFNSLAPLADTVIGDAEIARNGMAKTEEFRQEANRIMCQALDDGAVILGRGGAAALQDRPDVLRIRLHGDRAERIALAERYRGATPDSVEGQLEQVDSARAKYVQHLYGRDIDDPTLYHLQINTPLFELDPCVDLIVAAYETFRQDLPDGSSEAEPAGTSAG